MHSAAFMGVSAAVHFPSLLFSVANSLITTATPCFKKRMGKIKLQVLFFSACSNPCSQFQVVVFNFR
jgi:hypothetical protein